MVITITDAEAMAAAETLLRCERQRLLQSQLDVVCEYHEDLIERLQVEIENIPQRTVAEQRGTQTDAQ